MSGGARKSMSLGGKTSEQKAVKRVRSQDPFDQNCDMGSEITIRGGKMGGIMVQEGRGRFFSIQNPKVV